MKTNKLFVVATPIGNLEDITIRAIRTLLEVPVIACEDTRHTGMLIKILFNKYRSIFGESELKRNEFSSKKDWDLFHEEMTKKKYISVRDWNEAKQVSQVIQALQESDVALVSDAGTPLISDPGYKLVNVVRAAGFEVVPIPGVSALTTALSVAGLPTDRVKFWGFFSEKYELDRVATNVFYESPVRLLKTLKFLKGKYGEINMVIANEMTKIHEAFLKPEEVENIKGEVTVIVSFDR